jgi:cell division protein FtsB
MSTPASSARPARKGRPAQIRWDRLGRIAMVVVIGVLAYLYISAGTRILSTWHLAASNRAKVAAMERQNRELKASLARLRQPNTIVQEGRRFGMVKSGEVPFFTDGLPRN